MKEEEGTRIKEEEEEEEQESSGLLKLQLPGSPRIDHDSVGLENPGDLL